MTSGLKNEGGANPAPAAYSRDVNKGSLPPTFPWLAFYFSHLSNNSFTTRSKRFNDCLFCSENYDGSFFSVTEMQAIKRKVNK